MKKHGFVITSTTKNEIGSTQNMRLNININIGGGGGGGGGGVGCVGGGGVGPEWAAGGGGGGGRGLAVERVDGKVPAAVAAQGGTVDGGNILPAIVE